jgi:hypothetical protein
MALQNLQQYGCQTGNKLKEKSCDLNRNSSRNKNETMFDSGYENYLQFINTVKPALVTTSVQQ